MLKPSIILILLPVLALSLPIEKTHHIESSKTSTETTTTEESKTTLIPAVKRDQSFLVLEEYKPLSSSFNRKDRAKAHAIKTKPVQKAQEVEVLIDFPEEPVEFSASGARQLGRISHFQLPTEKGPLVFDPQKHKTESHWLDWTKFGPCSNGERTRVRQCLEVNNVKCVGPSVQSQRCFGLNHSNTAFGDPLAIEKAIAEG